MIATKGQICPACGGEEITIGRLAKDMIQPGEKFHCPLCDEVLTYSVGKHLTGDRLLLKIDRKSFLSSQEIAVSSIRMALARSNRSIVTTA